MPLPTRPQCRTPARRKAASEYVPFSSKLTDSLDDISGMIRDHQEMIDNQTKIN